ncbi:MAG: VWA domain-containing protein [Paludibacteraceae bacterium]|jgi:Ca-activated chloride channel family protein|nr:VWA domain-containing protein [Paludibacteraceae bacterium]
MTFSNPGYLFLLLLLIPIIGWYLWKLHSTRATVQLSSTSSLQRHPRSLRVLLVHMPFVFRVLIVALLAIGLARPQLSNRWQSESTEGIDIMLALDISGTMQIEDLRPNRLEAAKAVATDFVLSRPNDQIGLVLFAGESFTQCPLTTDHAVLVNLFQSVHFGMIEDGTAIGLGLANAVNRMKDSSTKSKVVILLTDGSNNRGDIDPMTAAEIAKTFDIRVYAIGVGSYATNYPNMGADFDETTLRNIAQVTGGEYFRATDNNSLRAIYEKIDQLEKTKIKVQEFSKRTECFAPFILAAMICLFLEICLRYFALRTIAE